ncbi:Het-C-domain-containing protein [Sodiomyces alkalinus F11]|uniref:Het-C-domain-containing protein n=1 Tax=Sodiomyces alkalinus (strain CBS 110278 / VKM F-3762 / F11) TaxID=1314773 RepID=A0A3N2QA42_SODAK|nr:Het-C-domain-containing protein [Sodiomyces alkalinus F11]ROT43612.1 Het-C-domain-containing protein [Sodiomyces alkalinus F11]
MFESRSFVFLAGLVLLLCLARPAAAFGAGNISSLSKIEGVNWRHGDIEDVLLTIAMARTLKGKKFSKLMLSRVYFGNWLRDYSQSIDVATAKHVSAEAVRLLVSVLGFLSFGYGSKEFEVTAERLGTYRPEEHIDNPKNYADNEDARRYDRRLRGPVDERRELAIDPRTGMKNYIANEQAGITTSAGLMRDLFSRCIQKGREFGRSKRDEDLCESLYLLGTALHCLEGKPVIHFFAHSNYTELALIEMGERDIFPVVGRDALIRLEGARGNVYPLVTGTFGGVDFLHSVTGEVTDKLKQNELQELESTLQNGKKNDTSALRSLLDKIPDEFFGGKHQSDRIDGIQQQAASSQMQNMSVSPREPEEFTRYIQGVFKQIMPIIEWHDDVMQSISGAFDKLPVLPKLLEQLEEQLTMFVYSNIAPFILPVIHQIQNEMKTGSEHLVESSQREQHNVFHDDRETDPTHSLLSKDHFTNLLNEPAGRAAFETVRWVVPQVMEAMDDERADIDRTITRIIYGVLHHPAQRGQGNDGIREGREIIFRTIEEWWSGLGRQRQEEYRRKLSRDGVRNHHNHKEGEHDTGHGHGCLGSLQMHKQFGKTAETWEDKIANKAAGAIFAGAAGAISSAFEGTTGMKLPTSGRDDKKESSSGGGGLIGSLLGGILNRGDKDREEEPQKQSSSSYGRTDESTYSYGGGRRDDSSSYGRTSGRREDESQGSSGYGGRQDTSSSGYGGRQNTSSGGYGGRREESSFGGSSGYSGGSGYGGRREESSYGGGGGGGSGGGYGGRREESGRGSGGYGGGRRDDQSSSRYGSRRDNQSPSGYGGRRDDGRGRYGGGQGGSGRY